MGRSLEQSVSGLRISRHVPALDGLRGTAVLLVLLVHLGGGRHSPHKAIRLVAESFRFGWTGVVLFFVLSGFLITGILWDSFAREDWWKRFYIRRSLRIFPLYYLCLLYALVLALVFSHSMLPALAAYAVYLQDIPWLNRTFAQVPGNRIVLVHFWSLAVEEQFYLLWPFLLFAFRTRRWAAMNICLIGVVASLGFRLAMLRLHADPMWCSVALPSRAGELLLGGWLALAVRGSSAEQAKLFRFVPAAFVVSLAGVVGIGLATHGSLELPEQPLWLGFGLLVLGVISACVLCLCLRPGFLQRTFENPVLRWYGKISYGVYIFHLILLPVCVGIVGWLAPSLGQTARDAVQAIGVVVGSTLLALFSFHTFEAYFLGLKDRVSANQLVPAYPSAIDEPSRHPETLA